MSKWIAVFLVSLAFASAANAEDDRYLTEKRDLAGILGEVHYLRTLCNGQTDQIWRNYMRDFLDIEAKSKSRRSTYVSAFNRGYKYQRRRMDSCSQSAVSVERSLSTKGRLLAEKIALSYLQ